MKLLIVALLCALSYAQTVTYTYQITQPGMSSSSLQPYRGDLVQVMSDVTGVEPALIDVHVEDIDGNCIMTWTIHADVSQTMNSPSFHETLYNSLSSNADLAQAGLHFSNSYTHNSSNGGFVANGEDVNGVEGVSVDNASSGDGPANGGSSSSGSSSSGTSFFACTPDEIDRTDICQPQVCDSERVWKQIPLDCNYGMTPCSCCSTCESQGMYLRGTTTDLQNNDGKVRTFLAECSAKLHPVRCIRLSSQWLQRDIIHMELQGTNSQLNEVSRLVLKSGFSVPSFPGPYSLVTGPSSGNANSGTGSAGNGGYGSGGVSSGSGYGPGGFSNGGGVTNNGGAGAGSSSGTSQSAPPADLLRPRMCGMLTRQTCYGVALGAEAGEPTTGGAVGAAVCGWSPMGSCGLTYIDEEGKEGDICAMKRTFWQCYGMANSGSSDRICVWNPMMRMCVGGELDQEPGDITGPAMLPGVGGIPQEYQGIAAAIINRFGGGMKLQGANIKQEIKKSKNLNQELKKSKPADLVQDAKTKFQETDLNEIKRRKPTALFDQLKGSKMKLKATHQQKSSTPQHDYRLFAVGGFAMIFSFASTLIFFHHRKKVTRSLDEPLTHRM